MKKFNLKDFLPSKDTIKMSPGEMLAAIRRLQNLTQQQLADKTNMTQANISSMESGRQQIGRERALTLAQALKVHPAVILFPEFPLEDYVK